jgi:ethanolamine permease
MAFNVGLYLTMAYTMLEAANANVLGYLLTTMSRLLGNEEELSAYPFAILAILLLALLNYRGALVTLSVNSSSPGSPSSPSLRSSSAC